ncbi:MAG: HAMP domain-containing histidine kinase, partial [Armatimonadetes bacterium]|nr:HAMP domain-containing histidine kinase [Armatimonadota bacterium]
YQGRAAKSGSGLGLALCKEIARQHGGVLTIESSPGAGTTVCVRLPTAIFPTHLTMAQ